MNYDVFNEIKKNELNETASEGIRQIDRERPGEREREKEEE